MSIFKKKKPSNSAKVKFSDDTELTSREVRDQDVEMLNHCFEDIEEFVNRLHMATENFKELDHQRQRHRYNSKKDEMLSRAAQPPPTKDFIEILQKFKITFNLLGKLKNRISDPNAPELVHFLFTPLSLVIEACKDPRRGTPDLAARVVSPLLTQDVIEMFHLCLTTKETELWLSLGNSWTRSRDEWNGYASPYVPQPIYGSWTHPPGWIENQDASIFGGSSRERESRSRERTGDEHGYRSHERRSRERSPEAYHSQERRARGRSPGVHSLSQFQNSADTLDQTQGAYQRLLMQSGIPPSCIMLVRQSRAAHNQSELSVRQGQILQLLDYSSNWWRLQNSVGQIGHVPYHILQQYRPGEARAQLGL